MKRKLLAVACAAASFSTVSNAESLMDKVTFVPTVGVQMKRLDFDQDLKGGTLLSDASGDFEVDMPVLSLGLTTIYDRFYVALKLDNSFDDATANSDVPFTNGPSQIQRDDLSLTFGMNVIENLNVFIGYMEGETQVKPFATDVATTGGNLAQAQASLGGDTYKQKYKEDGYFFGASYGLPIQEIGTLSVSVAWAIMDGLYEDNFVGTNGATPTPGPGDFEYDGDSKGYSLGLTWSAPLTAKVGYYVDLRAQVYDFDGDDSEGNFPGSSVETTETMTTATAGIQWYF